jgi:type IV secretory pathway TraG/TraD family ATPase VirD4
MDHIDLYRRKLTMPDLYRPKLPSTFGSAPWATMSDVRHAGALERARGKDAGPIIGCLTPAEVGGRDIHYLFANGETSMASFGPAGSGKTSGQIITNLLCWPGSAVVLDIKGEIYQRTAGWREANGHRIVAFRPFEQRSARWNPIDHINDGCDNTPNHPRRQESSRYLANLGITVNPNAKEPYFDNAAKSLMQMATLFVATAPLEDGIVRERTMAEVLRLVAQQEPLEFKKTLAAMAKSPEDMVRQGACTMLHMEAAREQSAGVKTVLMEHMGIWGYRRVQEATSATDFSFKELRMRGEDAKPTTVYIIIPPEALSEYRVLLRVMIGACVRELRETWSAAVDDIRPPVMLFLDEFPQLHHMEPIEDALLYMRSYACRFWFYCQSLYDLQRHYPDSWRGFIANCGTRCFFGVSDIETAKLVSEMSGMSTVTNRSYQFGVNESDTHSNSSTSGSGSSSTSGPGWFNSSSGSSSFSSTTVTDSRTVGSSLSSTQAYVGRPLIMPDEILRMPYGSMIALVKGMPAMRSQLRFWHQDPEFRQRGMIPPPAV